MRVQRPVWAIACRHVRLCSRSTTEALTTISAVRDVRFTPAPGSPGLHVLGTLTCRGATRLGRRPEVLLLGARENLAGIAGRFVQTAESFTPGGAKRVVSRQAWCMAALPRSAHRPSAAPDKAAGAARHVPQTRFFVQDFRAHPGGLLLPRHVALDRPHSHDGQEAGAPRPGWFQVTAWVRSTGVDRALVLTQTKAPPSALSTALLGDPSVLGVLVIAAVPHSGPARPASPP